jgi:hypothetical protein
MSTPRPHVQIVLGTTRQERRGENVGRWLFEVARRRADFTVELIDLRD